MCTFCFMKAVWRCRQQGIEHEEKLQVFEITETKIIPKCITLSTKLRPGDVINCVFPSSVCMFVSFQDGVKSCVCVSFTNTYAEYMRIYM